MTIDPRAFEAAKIAYRTEVAKGVTHRTIASSTDALAAAIQAYEKGLWRDVETDPPPQDGTWVLIRGRNSVGRPMVPVVCRWSKGVAGDGPAAWRDSAHDRLMSSLIADVPPGHSADWRPLPPMPEGEV